MDDTNRVVVELDCPRCGGRREMQVRMRYGPVGHPPLAPGERIEWGHGGQRLAGPSDEPALDIPALARCGACVSLAASYGKREFRRLRSRCERIIETDDTLTRRRDVELGHLLAHLDYQYRLKKPTVLAGEPIQAPGRLIEKMGELVLGYSPALFDVVAVRVRIDRDRIAEVTVLPLPLQHVLKLFPVSMHFGSFASGHGAVLEVLNEAAPEQLADALVRAALALELGEWRGVLGCDAEGRMDFTEKLRHLLGQLSWTPARVSALARIDRFTAADELERILDEALGVAPEALEEASDALRAALA